MEVVTDHAADADAAGHYHPGYSDKTTSRKRSNQRISTLLPQVRASSLPALKADQSMSSQSVSQKERELKKDKNKKENRKKRKKIDSTGRHHPSQSLMARKPDKVHSSGDITPSITAPTPVGEVGVHWPAPKDGGPLTSLVQRE